MEGRPPRGRAPRFGRRLAELRRQRGLTQARLALGLGLKPDVVAYYERKAKNPTLAVVHHVADFFEVPVGYFLDDDEPMQRHPKRGPASEIEKRLEKLRDLPRKEIRVALAMLDAVIEAHAQRKARRSARVLRKRTSG